MRLQTVIVFCLALLFSAAVTAEPLLMVTDVAGKASVTEDGKTRKVELLSYLESGAELQLESGARISLTSLSSPLEYRFTGPEKLTVGRDGVRAQNGKAETRAVSLQKTSAARKFTAAQREGVVQAAYEMRTGGRPGLRLDDPVDTRVLDGGSVLFTWSGPRAAGGYRLSLYDRKKQLLHQLVLSSPSWTAPSGLLKAGEEYAWEIQEELENGEALTARGSFTVADAETVSELRAQAPAAGAEFSERVLYAVLLETKGFQYDARRLWQELASERPDDAAVKERAMR